MLVVSMMLSQISFAQVKRQYQDQKYAETVVVKHDNASDVDILTANFDLDDLSMGQVIKITTEADKPVANLPTESIQTVKEEETILPEQTVNQVQEIESIAANTVATPTEVEETVETPTRTARVRKGGGNYPVYSGFQGFGKQKRFKKKKRKRKSNKKCFKF